MASASMSIPPPTYQPPAKWGLPIPDGVRAMNTSSSVVMRYFRGHNEHMKIAGPGETPNVPISQQQLQSVPSSSSSPKQQGKLESNVPANESEWDRDMRLIKENEYWEGRIVDIATDLQDRYREKFQDMGVSQKIGVFKMLEYFHWNYERSLELLQILEKTPNDLVMNMVGIFQVFETKERYLDTGIDFFVALNEHHFMDLLSNYTFDQVCRLVELRKHLCTSDRHVMVDHIIHQLSIRHLFEALELCNEPTAKACRLCRIRRLDALEFRMIHEQFPEGTIRVPGCIPVLNRADVYTADDDKFFSFDITRGLVFFKRELVDLVRICSTCMQDVAGAAAANKKFENLYDLTPRRRKAKLNLLRGEEQQAGELFEKIEYHRLLRRAREFALKALEAERHGHRLEADAKARASLEAHRQAELAAAEERKQIMLAASLKVDKKWIRQEKVHIASEGERYRVLGELGMHPGYSDVEGGLKAPKGPLSIFTEPESAKVFGIGYTTNPVDHAAMKFEQHLACEIGKIQDEKRKEVKRMIREREIAEYKHALAVIQRHMAEQLRRRRALQREKEYIEEQRLDGRAAARVQRRLVRIAGYEAAERNLMYYEDMLALESRRLLHERANEAREQGDMFMCEVEQRVVDDFWGIDKHAWQLARDEERRKHIFISKTEELRRMMVHVGAIQPYTEEQHQRTGLLPKAITGDFHALYRHHKTGDKLQY